MKHTVLEELYLLTRQVAGTPELLFVAFNALGNEMERLSITGMELELVRGSSRALILRIGDTADKSWKQLTLRERCRNWRRKTDWKMAHTHQLLIEGHDRVDAILDEDR